MIENIIAQDKIESIDALFDKVKDDEPCIVIQNNSPAFVALTYDAYEKLVNTVKIFNSEYLNIDSI